MKELSIEEKVKRYDEALEEAKKFYALCKKCGAIDTINFLENTFPELKESKDERIRRIIRGWIYTQPASFFDNGISKEEILAWLEKQDEQKLANKVESKFHEGEYIVDNCGYVWKIEGILNQFYVLEGVEGGESRPTIEWVDKTFHRWTIKDAKDGEILIDKSNNRECPFIFKEIKPSDMKTNVLNPLTVLGYCGIGGAGFTKSSGWGDTANCTYYPATKEQCDFLLQKMKEAGYEWDAENKKLKNIEV